MTRAEAITDELRADILSGAFLPGDRLVELELSEHYDVGRAAVRQALLELAGEGLVVRKANRGATVRRLTVQEVIQVTEARRVLESLIAAHAARNATTEEREELRAIERDMREAVEHEAYDSYSDLNGRLHRRLREISRHRVADQLVQNLRNRSAHHQYRLALVPGRPRESVEQHAAIVAAVAAGDETAAAEAMEAHLQSVIDVLERWSAVAGP